MLNVIYKYPFTRDEFPFLKLSLPEGYKILSAQNQNGMPVVWIQIPASKPSTEVLNLEAIPTGSLFTGSSEALSRTYIDTVQCGEYVWHIYRTDYARD